MKRRQFLANCGTTLTGLTLFPRQVFAQELASTRRFLVVYFEGGWDVLLSLDPRDPRETNAAEHQIEPAYDQLGSLQNRGDFGIQSAAGLRLGPSVPPTLLSLADRLSIINGIGMNTASHEVGRRYFITGRFPRGTTAVGSSTPSEIVAQSGEHFPIPHLSAGVEAYSDALPHYASALSINTANDLGTAFTPFAQFDPDVLAAVQGFQDATPDCSATRSDATGLVSQMRSSQQRARSFVEGGFSRFFDFNASDSETERLRQLYGLNRFHAPGAPGVAAYLASQALKNNVSQAVSVRVAAGLDTHSDWADTQPDAQENGWRLLAAMLEDLRTAPLP
ncbi:MAG: DUF1501 domain-containing protein, partial [Myxococcota bacterium]